jgi:proline iminopeptidase
MRFIGLTLAAAAVLGDGAGELRTSDGVKLHYRAVGSGGETVVIPVAVLTAPHFDALAKARRVVYYDPRGRGRSERGPLDSVSLERAARDLEELRVHLGVERMAVIGFSGYGMEMAQYALAYPGRVTRLVQLAPVPPVFRPWGEQGMQAREPRLDRAALADYEALAARKASGEEQCLALQRAMLPAVMAQPQRTADDEAMCRLANEWPDNIGAFYGRLLKDFDRLDLRPRLSELRFPRLVMHAERDTFPLAGSEAWVSGQKDARLLLVADAGHTAFRDQPRVVLAAIETFLGGAWPEGSRTIP